MPIAPETRWLYPIDWRELSRVIRFGRAKGACERCGRRHGAEITHLGDGRGTWWDAEREHWRDGRGRRVRGLPRPEVIEAMQPWLEGLEPQDGQLRSRPAKWLPTTRVVLASAHLDHDPGHNRTSPMAQ